MYTLRKNQEVPVQVAVDYFKGGSKEPSLIVAPPGMGKSVIIAHVAKELKGKLLILQPSKELLEQNFGKFTGIGGEASIYSASMGEKEFENKVVYATIGSIKELGRVFRRLGFTRLIIDEADRYPVSEESMLSTFLAESEIESVLGFTASPFKLESKTLASDKYSVITMLTEPIGGKKFFKNILHVTQIEDMVKDGWWCPLTYESTFINYTKLEYNSTKGEYTSESIEDLYKDACIEDKIAQRVKELEGYRNRILIFVPSVGDAISLSEKIEGSEVVWGKMNPKDRIEIIDKFRSGDVRVVINVNVLGVGFDYPEIDCIILARPTASLSLYYQQIGRGVRLSDTKKNCLIIDYSSNVNRFGRIEKMHLSNTAGKWNFVGEKGLNLTGVPTHRIGIDNDEKPYKEFMRASYAKTPSTMAFDFGKFKGILVSKTPRYYLRWLLDNFDFKRQPELKKEIERVLS